MTSTRRLRILIVTGIFPPDIGGPATYVPAIAESLAKRGHLVTVVTLSDCLKHADAEYPFQVVRISRALFKPWRWLRTVLSLIRLGCNSDVLLVNGLAMEAALANIILRKPMVQKIVGDLAWERATNLGWVKDNFEVFQEKRYDTRVELLKALRNSWTSRADKIIVPSRYLSRWVAKWGVGEERIVVIYNAREPADDIQPTRISMEAAVKVVTVGRLVPWKHVDKVIDVIARFNNIGIVIIGDGPERLRLEQLAKDLDVVERVYFAGQRTKSETLSLMAACDLLVLNSTYEGFPHVVLEAMGVGLPVVATAVGGTPEVVEDGFNGLLVAPMNDGSLHEGLSKLVLFPQERQRLANGARQIVQRFCVDRMVEETEGLLQGAARVERRR